MDEIYSPLEIENKSRCYMELLSQTRRLVTQSVASRLDVPQSWVDEIYRTVFAGILKELSHGNEVLLGPFGRFIYQKSHKVDKSKLFQVKMLHFERSHEMGKMLLRMTEELKRGNI